MSRDMFGDDTQKTPVTFKAPRTPSMTPTRSVKRRASSVKRQTDTPTPTPTDDGVLRREAELATTSMSQPCGYEEFYNLRTRLVPLFNNMNDIWAPYGINDGAKTYLEPRSVTDNQEGGVRANHTKCPECLRQACLVLLSAFLGALCLALILLHYNFLNTTLGLSTHQIVHHSLDNQQVPSVQMENLVLHLSEEVKYLKDHFSKLQQKSCGEVMPSSQTGILEELLTADLACAGNLGRVLATPGTNTLTIPASVKFLKFFSFNVWVYHNLPHTTLQGLIQNVGDCWPFEGSYGRLVLKLHQRSLVTGVSLSHVPFTISATGDITSAPRYFQVLVHQREDDLDSGQILGQFEYKMPGAWRQTFPLELLNKEDSLVDIIEFRFLNNHGNPNYTCVYRVHVHGKFT